MQDKLNELLKKYWGYDAFREGQLEIIESIVSGEATLSVMPTGGGKSLCYQLPAIYMEGTAVVISPLISLMKDQVDTLVQMGVRAAYINSSLSEKEKKQNLAKAWNGELDLLYIAPERFEYDYTIEMLKSIKISFFVIDEAHCVSHWGHDFRPAYGQLSRLKDLFPSIKTHSFTATATKNVCSDIVSLVYGQHPKTRISSVDRENLSYSVAPRASKMGQIVDVLNKHRGEPGIIYCLTRKEVDAVVAKLNSKGFDAIGYHAGYGDAARKKHQDMFVNEKIDIVVATVAFGMGVDRSNVRWVIHTAMPKTLEHYQQETGRAGRDGLKSYCYLFYGSNEYRLQRGWVEDSPNAEVMIKKLNSMYDYCQSFACRHKKLVEYFDQQYVLPSCEACDFCNGEVETAENSNEISKSIALCVEEIYEHCGYGFGVKHISDILRGADTDKIRDKGHDSLSSYGQLKDEDSFFISDAIEQLINFKVLERTGKYNVIGTGSYFSLLFNDELDISLGKQKKQTKVKKSTFMDSLSELDVDKDLFELLRKKRQQIARKKGVPAYLIFTDKSLLDMAVRVPCDQTSFLTINGVGEQKARQYGSIFTQIIRAHAEGV